MDKVCEDILDNKIENLQEYYSSLSSRIFIEFISENFNLDESKSITASEKFIKRKYQELQKGLEKYIERETEKIEKDLENFINKTNNEQILLAKKIIDDYNKEIEKLKIEHDKFTEEINRDYENYFEVKKNKKNEEIECFRDFYYDSIKNIVDSVNANKFVGDCLKTKINHKIYFEELNDYIFKQCQKEKEKNIKLINLGDETYKIKEKYAEGINKRKKALAEKLLFYEETLLYAELAIQAAKLSIENQIKMNQSPKKSELQKLFKKSNN